MHATGFSETIVHFLFFFFFFFYENNTFNGISCKEITINKELNYKSIRFHSLQQQNGVFMNTQKTQ